MNNINMYVIYPGRFQPMGAHHVQVYNSLVSKFGKDKVYVGTSDNTSTLSNPLSFEQKKTIAVNLGVPATKVFKSSSPYNIEGTAADMQASLGISLDPLKDVLIFAYGEKDLGRLSFYKKDGTPGRFQPYVDGPLEPFGVHAYVYIAPLVQIVFNDSLLSGTELRKYMKTATEDQFTQTMGFFDADIYSTLTKEDEPLTVPDTVESTFSRIDYYRDYIANIVPESFQVEIQDGHITVKLP